MGATDAARVAMATQSVSIHAPVMGATRDKSSLPALVRVSIHAPVMGATRVAVLLRRPKTGFNPRARDGRDRHSLSC
tara:strand:- start:23444 stop:23674 length:231 start_codon:yes stop_codon:yes gene_type:complete